VAPTCSLCAYVVPARKGSRVNEEALKTGLERLMRENLPSYSIPSTVVAIDNLPLSANNKLDVKALSEWTSKNDSSPYPAPENLLTPFEEKVAAALLEVLSLPTDQVVSPETTYGQLGGGSLQACLVLRHLNKSFSFRIHLRQFYRNTVSIRSLADLILEERQQTANQSSSDLVKRTILPRDIFHNVGPPSIGHQSHVLLTGCTGFLGSHLLAEILSTGGTRVSCIVRATNLNSAHNRIKAALLNWDLWDESFTSRIDVYCGDVSKPFLGLSTDEYLYLARQVDTIYHSAAAVSFIAPFSELEDANVDGTIEILRFASTLTPKRLTYISTLAVFFGAGNTLPRGLEIPVDKPQNDILTGYAQSKWVTEQLVNEYARLGGHALILRPGRLLGSTRNYKCPQDDFTIRLIASILEMGTAPKLDDIGVNNWEIDLTPVDFCARLVHRFSLSGETGIRHVINKNTVQFETLVNSLGGNIQRVPYREWLQLIDQSVHLQALSSLFHEPISDSDERSTCEGLLQKKVFRCSGFDVSTGKDESQLLPSTLQLLDGYLRHNEDIFSNAK